MTIMNTSIGGGGDVKPYIDFKTDENTMANFEAYDKQTRVFGLARLKFKYSGSYVSAGYYPKSFQQPTTVRTDIEWDTISLVPTQYDSYVAYNIYLSDCVVMTSAELENDYGISSDIYVIPGTSSGSYQSFNSYKVSQLTGIATIRTNYDGNIKLKGIIDKLGDDGSDIYIIIDKNGDLVSTNMSNDKYIPVSARFVVTDIELL